jgi:hypothetical protein
MHYFITMTRFLINDNNVKTGPLYKYVTGKRCTEEKLNTIFLSQNMFCACKTVSSKQVVTRKVGSRMR